MLIWLRKWGYSTLILQPWAYIIVIVWIQILVQRQCLCYLSITNKGITFILSISSHLSRPVQPRPITLPVSLGLECCVRVLSASVWNSNSSVESNHEIRQSDSSLSADIQAKIPIPKLIIVRTCSLKIRQYEGTQASIVCRTGLATVWCYCDVINNCKIF